MRIGELASACDCPVETIRYYEKIGLLPAARREPNGYRQYDDAHRKWLQFILHSRALGFTQDDVRRLTNLAHETQPPCADVHALLVQHLDGVRSRLQGLRRLEKALRRLEVKCHDGTLDECPVIDELMR